MACGPIVKGYGFGLIRNIVVGIIGASLPLGYCHWLDLFWFGGIVAEITNSVICVVTLARDRVLQKTIETGILQPKPPN